MYLSARLVVLLLAFLVLAPSGASAQFSWSRMRATETVVAIIFQNCEISFQQSCVWTFQGRKWSVKFPTNTIVATKTRVYYMQINFDNLRCTSPGLSPARCRILAIADDGDILLSIDSPLGAQTNQSWHIDAPMEIKWIP